MGTELLGNKRSLAASEPPEAAAAAWAGAPPSNTAPANSNSDGISRTRIVGAGLDSLYLTYQGCLRAGLQKLLETLKNQAQSPDPDARSIAQMPVGDWVFHVSPKGARMFSYVLTDPRFRLELSRGSSSGVPLAHVQISSAVLSAYGPERSANDLGLVLDYLANDVSQGTISRADLFVDITTDNDISDLADRQWVTRAHSIARYSDKGQRSGYSIGRGGDLVMRIYNKPLEMLHSGKIHAQRQWLVNGWDGKETVWRVELQIRRNLLRQFNVDALPSLLSQAGPLWHYGVEKWCRLAIPSALDETRSRWATHPFWTAVTRAPDFAISIPVPRRSLRQSRAASDDSIADYFLGAITSYMAKYGDYQAGRAIEDLVGLIDWVLGAREGRTGLSPSRQISRKVAEKVRRFCTGRSYKVPHEIRLTTEVEPLQRKFEDEDNEK